jgi:nitrite reductase (NADH) large subunit
VIIEDTLGIAQDLETEMQGLVNRYECEWKQAVENEEVMKRFKHFVNSDDTDDTIKFVPMRTQKMPKAWV